MPLSPEARRALEMMNRGPLKNPPGEAPPEPPADVPAEESVAPTAAAEPTQQPRRGGGRRGSTHSGPPGIPGRSCDSGAHFALPDAPPGTPPTIEHLVPGEVAAGRPHYVHERVLQAPFTQERTLAQALLALGDPGSRVAPGILPQVPPEEFLFLDIESVGLFNGPLFLIGLLMLHSGSLVVRQLLARDYSEEAGVLEAASGALRERPGLITFNGRSFDMPYIANRCAYHRLPIPEEEWHTDLLLVARRHWRRFLPNCRLQTIEQHVCGRHRVGDIPGEMMGQVYHDFVRTGNATDIRRALHHNLLDLVAMAEMLCVLAGS